MPSWARTPNRKTSATSDFNSMATLISQSRLHFGIPSAEQLQLPIRHSLGAEILKVRMRFREDDWGAITVKTENGLHRFIPQFFPDHILLDPNFEQGINLTK
jgi:hypothetical protein